MNFRLFFLLCITVQCLFPADSINIALYGKPFVKYVGGIPYTTIGIEQKPDASRMNPNNLIDKNYFTFLQFSAGEPSNIGSSFGIELLDSVTISSIRIINLGNNVISGFTTRLRAFSVYGSRDTLTWQKLYQITNNKDSARSIINVSSPNRWKYVKVVVDSMDKLTASVVAELEIYMLFDSTTKTIKAVTFSPVQYVNGESINQINWQGVNLSSNDKVNIYYKLPPSNNFLPLSLNEPNDGSFSWNTTLIMDGNYTILVEPAVAGDKFGLSENMTVQNYSNAKIGFAELNRSSQADISRFYSSAYFKDSITLNWSYSTKIKKNIFYHLNYSLDSGKSWIPIITINDSSKRSYTWKVPMVAKTGLYSFLSNEFYVDTARVARLVSPIPHILLEGFDVVSIPWITRSHVALVSSYRGTIASFALQNSGKNVLLFGPTWMLYSNGDTSSNIFWNTYKSIGPIAVSDLTNDGQTEIISRSMISETGEILSYDTTNTFGSDPVVIDVDNNGVKEIIYHKNNSFNVVSNAGKLLRTITVPTAVSNNVNITAVADMNGDGQKDYLFAPIDGNSIYGYTQSGIGLSGYPIVIGDLIRSSPLIADLFHTDEPNIVVSSRNNIYCFGKNGNLLNGFPYTVPFIVNTKSVSIADIDNDGFLDIIFTATYANSLTRIYCINRFGENIQGWPITITDSYIHYLLDWDSDPINGSSIPVTMNGSLSSPYILSVDGDWNNEIIFFSTNGYMYAFDRFGKTKNGFPQFIGAYPNVSSHFGDFDNNGSLNAIVPVTHQGVLYMMNMDFGPNSYNASRMPWPTERQNVERTGIAPQAIPVSVRSQSNAIPLNYSLAQNFPNPFNPQTSVRFGLASSGLTSLKVYDVLGREVTIIVNEVMEAGVHLRNFSAVQLNSGVYFYTLRSGNFTETKKMMILK